ncbi:cellulase family glycosylhydrolase [candidate division KSB1 bacterium]|nr:cellulase family glycosylhydrolase [candidate division KSB1 bacterium]
MVRSLYLAVIALTTIFSVACSRTPIRPHPDNPHYFEWRGKPAVLLTSGEHYGAVLNLDFDFEIYLQTLQAAGLNLTRTFSGVYCEHPGAFNISKNTLAPAAGKLACPWARSVQPGYRNGGTKFDLEKWDDAYFERLQRFLGRAAAHGIVVELVLFCPFYGDEQWQLSPLHIANNINGIGDVDRTEVYTLQHQELTRVQENMVRKIVTELNEFDNLYYEICNEPYFAGPTLEWQAYIAKVIRESEATLPKKHMIAQNIANNAAKIENPDANVDLFNFHYALPSAVDDNYHLNKALGDDETGFSGTGDEPYRLEAWNFMLAGGAVFSHLDYSFTVDDEDGTYAFPATQPGGGGAALRRQIRILKEFIEGFDFIRMRPMQEIFASPMPSLQARALGCAGEYAIYFSQAQQLRENYSLRWRGRLTPLYSDVYTFHTITDDGVRLWVDGEKLIDDWTSHAPTENAGEIRLRANVPVDIRMEYFQGRGGAQASLWWSSAGQEKQIIPAAQFALPDGSAPGLIVEWFDDIELKDKLAEAVVFQVAFSDSLTGLFPVQKTEGEMAVDLALPAGSYQAQWLEPISGDVIKIETVQHATDVLTLALPTFDRDIALALRKLKE